MSAVMRTHSAIVRAIGAAALARLLTEQGVEVGTSTPQRWADRNSIPGEYWAALDRLNVASLHELAAAADAGQQATAA